MQADFFNNVAAVAVVLMFTKVVTHRLPRGDAKALSSRNGAYHAATVIAAAMAIIVALLATGVRSDNPVFYITASAMLGVTGMLVLVDEIRPSQQRSRQR
ncbi:hypothetical protein ACQI5H_23060 [Mycobacterium heidelbergense]|uniref:hypothetical protein n=1 Tax=Mycobacterium heidelbergense TaxID=53376 RepID=UPI003CEF8138